MRLGIRTAISALVLTSIVVSAVGVHLLWQPTISWVAFGWPDGSFFAGHKAGDGVIEMLEITPDRNMRINRYEFVGNDLRLKASWFEETDYSVTEQEWFRVAKETNDEYWSTLTTHPRGERLAAAFSAPLDIDKKPAGVIAIIIELTRVSNFLSQLTVGKSAGAFILERNGKVVASPDPNANEAVALKTDHPLFPIAVEAIQNASAYEPGEGQPFNTKVVRDGKAYQAV